MTFTAKIEPLVDRWRITIQQDDFIAHADFPLSLGGVARDRFNGLATPEDVENLLREFGETTEYHAWQART